MTKPVRHVAFSASWEHLSSRTFHPIRVQSLPVFTIACEGALRTGREEIEKSPRQISTRLTKVRNSSEKQQTSSTAPPASVWVTPVLTPGPCPLERAQLLIKVQLTSCGAPIWPSPRVATPDSIDLTRITTSDFALPQYSPKKACSYLRTGASHCIKQARPSREIRWREEIPEAYTRSKNATFTEQSRNKRREKYSRLNRAPFLCFATEEYVEYCKVPHSWRPYRKAIT